MTDLTQAQQAERDQETFKVAVLTGKVEEIYPGSRLEGLHHKGNFRGHIVFPDDSMLPVVMIHDDSTIEELPQLPTPAVQQEGIQWQDGTQIWLRVTAQNIATIHGGGEAEARAHRGEGDRLFSFVVSQFREEA